MEQDYQVLGSQEWYESQSLSQTQTHHFIARLAFLHVSLRDDAVGASSLVL